MTFFTSQEKKIIIFLIISLLLGTIILYLKKNYSPFYNFLSLNEFNDDSPIIKPKIYPKKNINNNVSSKKEKLTNKIKINFASSEELERIPQIGSKTAKQIIEMRSKKKFTSSTDLILIRGVGEKKQALLEKYFSFETTK